jgi:hypothetical protein
MAKLGMQALAPVGIDKINERVQKMRLLKAIEWTIITLSLIA